MQPVIDIHAEIAPSLHGGTQPFWARSLLTPDIHSDGNEQQGLIRGLMCSVPWFMTMKHTEGICAQFSGNGLTATSDGILLFISSAL